MENSKQSVKHQQNEEPLKKIEKTNNMMRPRKPAAEAARELEPKAWWIWKPMNNSCGSLYQKTWLNEGGFRCGALFVNKHLFGGNICLFFFLGFLKKS